VGRIRPEPSRIAFLGFGLIGASIAMALRARARAGDSLDLPAASARRLAAELDRELPSMEGRAEARAFTPHLTIARTDGLRLASEAAHVLAAAADGHEWSFRADRVVLFRSHLGSGPAWYEPIAEAALGG